MVDELHPLKRGRPLHLGKVQSYLLKVPNCGGVVNSAIAIAGAKGLLKKLNCTMLSEFGGHVTLSKTWAQPLLSRMGFVKRRGLTKFCPTILNFGNFKEEFLAKLKSVVMMDEIPPELVFNWDQTGINIVSTSQWTMEVEGSKCVEIAGLTDKRQITAVFLLVSFFRFSLYIKEILTDHTQNLASRKTGT